MAEDMQESSTLEAEKAVLSDLFAIGIADKYLALLNEDDFENELHRKLFSAIQAVFLRKEAITEVSVGAELDKRFGASSGEPASMMASIRRKYAFTKGATAGQNVTIVKESSKRRHAYALFIEAADRIQRQGNELADTFELVRTGMKKLEGDDTQSELIHLPDVLLAAYSEIEDRANGIDRGIPSGLGELDKKTAGFHRGEMTIIGARPSVGKSAFAMQLAIHAAAAGVKVLICSREMTAEQYGTRILLRGTELDGSRLRSGDIDERGWAQLSDSLTHYSNIGIMDFCFKVKYVEDLRRVVERMSNGDGLDVLVVDYVQLMQTRQRFDKDYLRIGYISKSLKDMTIDYNIAVVALAQVGRSADGDMPTLAELRGSGDLEQDADNVIFMHRPENPGDKWVRKTDKDRFNGWLMQGLQYIVFRIDKQRQGEIGTTAALFKPQTLQYAAIPERWQDGDEVHDSR